MSKYRSRTECRNVIRAIIAESSPPPLESFKLTHAEENFFRRRTARALDRAAQDTCAFTEYYALPMARPVWNLIIASVVMIVAVLGAATILYFYAPDSVDRMPLFTGCLAVTVAAVGWVVAGGFAYRNTVRQNTINMLFARFSQGPINEAFHRFGRAFGYDENDLISQKRLDDLRASGKEDDFKAASTVGFILNYFELLANGVISGDLNHAVVKGSIRGSIVYFYDRCEPFIRNCTDENARVYEQLRRLRAN
jgi:hypothetical protein